MPKQAARKVTLSLTPDEVSAVRDLATARGVGQGEMLRRLVGIGLDRMAAGADPTPRNAVMEAFEESLHQYDEVYRALAQ